MEKKDNREYDEHADKKGVDDEMVHIKTKFLAHFANQRIHYDLVRVRDAGWRVVEKSESPESAPPRVR
ncbi:MAG: hypothetical protein ACREJQ_01975 [bacterium]